MLKRTRRVNCRASTKLFLRQDTYPSPYLLTAGGFFGCCRRRNRPTVKRTVGFTEILMFVPAWKHGIKDISIKYVYLTVHASRAIATR